MIKLPFYAKIAQVLLAIVAFFFILYIGSDILVPLVFAMILAILLNPMVNFLTRRKFNRVLSIVLAILTMFLVIFGIFFFIGAQISMFREALPELKTKGTQLIEHCMNWASRLFRTQKEKMEKGKEKKKWKSLKSAGGKVGSTVGGLGSMLLLNRKSTRLNPRHLS